MDMSQQPKIIESGDDFLLQKIGYLLLPSNTLGDFKSLNIVFEHKKGQESGESCGELSESPLERMKPVASSDVKVELHKQVKDIIRHLRILKGTNALDVDYSEVFTLAKVWISSGDYEKKYQGLISMVEDNTEEDIPTPQEYSIPLGSKSTSNQDIKNLYDSHLFILNTAWGIISDAINKAEERSMVRKMERDPLLLDIGSLSNKNHIVLMDEEQKSLYAMTQAGIRKDITWFSHIRRRISSEDNQELGFGKLWLHAVKKTFEGFSDDVLHSADLEAKYGGRFFYPPPSMLN